MELAMLIGAKVFTLADDAFAPRQMHPTMCAAHHILTGFVFWRVFPLDPAAIAFNKAVNNPGGQSKKYQFDQHRPTPLSEVPQVSKFGHELVGVRGFEPPASASRTQRSTRLSYTPL
jgi:hypothetical protein